MCDDLGLILIQQQIKKNNVKEFDLQGNLSLSILPLAQPLFGSFLSY